MNTSRTVASSDMIRFSDNNCYIGDAIKLEAPLEAFGQCKLVSAFGELTSAQVLFTAAALHLELEVTSPRGSIPVPYDELRWTAMAMLQRMWFEQIPGGVPRSVQSNYDERFEHYQRTLDQLKTGEYKMSTTAPAANTKAPKTPKTPKAPKSTSTFTFEMSKNELTKRIVDGVANEQTTNHDFIIVAILQSFKAPTDLTTITNAVNNTGRYATKDELSKSVRWHLAKLEKEGVVIAHETKIQVVTEPTASPETAKVDAELGSLTQPPVKAAKPPAVVGTKSSKPVPAPKA